MAFPFVSGKRKISVFILYNFVNTEKFINRCTELHIGAQILGLLCMLLNEGQN